MTLACSGPARPKLPESTGRLPRLKVRSSTVTIGARVCLGNQHVFRDAGATPPKKMLNTLWDCVASCAKRPRLLCAPLPPSVRHCAVPRPFVLRYVRLPSTNQSRACFSSFKFKCSMPYCEVQQVGMSSCWPRLIAPKGGSCRSISLVWEASSAKGCCGCVISWKNTWRLHSTSSALEMSPIGCVTLLAKTFVNGFNGSPCGHFQTEGGGFEGGQRYGH